MKNVIKIGVLTFGMVLAFALTATAQNKVENAEFEVRGVCDMCKKRIEDAALIKGVKYVEWDKNAQSIEVIYNTQKTDLNTIQKAIASAGHDTKDVKAANEVYAELPGCCQYRDGDVHVH